MTARTRNALPKAGRAHCFCFFVFSTVHTFVFILVGFILFLCSSGHKFQKVKKPKRINQFVYCESFQMRDMNKYLKIATKFSHTLINYRVNYSFLDLTLSVPNSSAQAIPISFSLPVKQDPTSTLSAPH